MDTLVVNLFGGPGSGKSTGAAYIFSKLKLLGIEAEYVPEFAKDKVWEQNKEVFNCQIYISGKQIFRIHRIIGKVQVIITDCPIAIGAIYSNEEPIKNAIMYEFNKNNNYNIVLNRIRPYSQIGRLQNEEETKRIDLQLIQMFKNNQIPYYTFDGDMAGYDKIVNEIYCKLQSTNQTQTK